MNLGAPRQSINVEACGLQVNNPPNPTRSPWIYMDSHAYPWMSRDIHAYPWISMDSPRYPWISMDIHGHPWISIHIHGYPWICPLSAPKLLAPEGWTHMRKFRYRFYFGACHKSLYLHQSRLLHGQLVRPTRPCSSNASCVCHGSIMINTTASFAPQHTGFDRAKNPENT